MSYKFPPHPHKQHWLFGNLLYFTKGKVDYIFESKKEVGDFFTIKNPIRDVVVLTNPEWIKYVLVDNNKNYTKSFAYEPIKLLLGNGLLTSEGEFWKRQRRLIQPAFYKESINAMSVVMLEESQLMLRKWQQKVVQNPTVNVSQDFYAFALNIVTKSLFVTDTDIDIQRINTLVTRAQTVASERIQRPLSPPIWMPTLRNIRDKKILDELDSIIYGIITQRRKSGIIKHDLLDLLIHAKDEDTGEYMDDSQLRDEVITLFMAGHETTAVALTWISVLLARHPHIQDKVIEELCEVLPNGKMPDYYDVRQMQYLRCVVDEAMRIYPPAWVVGRKTIHEDTIKGFHIPPNTNVVMPIIAVHRDPDIWEKPMDFVPERFFPENIKDKHKYAYFPFGGGPRLCIGNNFSYMSMYMLLAILLPKFRFYLPKDYREELNPLITLRPAKDIFMQIEKIDLHQS